MGEEYVRGMCHTIEDPTFDATAVATNPRAQVRPGPPAAPGAGRPDAALPLDGRDRSRRSIPVFPHPNRALVEASLHRRDRGAAPAADRDAEPGGWDDYNRDFDPDFQLEDFSHRALVVALQEFAVQSHLLFRSFLLTVAQRFGEEEAARINPMVFTGSGRAHRAAAAHRDEASPATVPRPSPRCCRSTPSSTRGRTWTSRSTSSRTTGCASRSWTPPSSPSADDYHWFAQLGGASDRALDAIVQAVNPRASVSRVDDRATG